MIIKGYQPVNFGTDVEPCRCDSNTSQIVEAGDITQFQTQMEVCNYAPDLITNGDFDDITGTGWTNNEFSFNGDTISSISTGEQTIQTSNKIMGVNIYYQLEIDIIINQGVPLLIFFENQKIAELTNNGKFVLSGICDSDTTAGSLKIISPQSNVTTIERIALYPLESDIGLTVSKVQADGTFSPQQFITKLGDTNNPTYDFFRFDRNTITVSFPWDYITDMGAYGLGDDYGCYVLGINGKCTNTNAQLGVFDSEMVMPVNFASKSWLDDETFPWRCDTANAVQVLADTGIMKYNLGGGASVTVTDVNTGTGKTGMRYSFKIKINTITAAVGSVTVSIGGASNVLQTTGIHEFDLIGVNDNGLTIDLADPSSNPIEIEYFRMNVSNASNLSLIDVDNSSNVFDFKESHPCSILLGAANNEDAFGLNFESAFYTPKARFKGDIRPTNYDAERDTHIDGLDRKIIDYFEQRKTSQIRLQNVPEYMVDWLSLFYAFNKTYVDGTEYVAENELEIAWNRFCDTAKVGIEVGEIRQNLVNANTKGLTAISDINNILVRLLDESEPIIFIDGDEINLKG